MKETIRNLWKLVWVLPIAALVLSAGCKPKDDATTDTNTSTNAPAK
jgi:hypothetical protein